MLEAKREPYTSTVKDQEQAAAWQVEQTRREAAKSGTALFLVEAPTRVLVRQELHIYAQPFPNPDKPGEIVDMPGGKLVLFEGQGYTHDAVWAAWIRDYYRDYKVTRVSEEDLGPIPRPERVIIQVQAQNNEDRDSEEEDMAGYGSERGTIGEGR